MTREEALKILHDNMQSVNLRRHCYAVGAVMKVLARRLGGDPKKWEVVGILHDSDWEKTKDEPLKHTTLTHQWLVDFGEDDPEILSAVKTHNYVHTGDNSPQTQMEWALCCCDELTGFIIAVTLVRPEKKLSSVTVGAVLKKWNKKEFAAGVDRKQIEMCEEKLGMPLPEFIGIALGAMQGISDDLGL